MGTQSKALRAKAAKALLALGIPNAKAILDKASNRELASVERTIEDARAWAELFGVTL